MAKIQALGVGQKISQDVQVTKQDPRAAGLAWGAIGQVAGQAADVAQSFVQKADAAEATDYALNNSVEYARQLNELDRSMKAKYANNPDGYAKAYEEEAVKIRQGIADNAPSDKARQGFLRNSDATMLSKITQGYAKEQSDKVYRYKKGNEDRSTAQGNMQYSNPDPIKAQIDIDKASLDIEEQVAAGLIGREEADGYLNDTNTKIRLGFMSGMESKGFAGIADPNLSMEDKAKAVDRFMAGDGKTPNIFSSMSPEHKLKFKEEALKSFKTQDKQRAKEQQAKLDQAIKSILSGKVSATTPDGYREVKNQMRGLASNNSLDPVLKEDMMKKLTKSVTEAEIKKRLSLGGDIEGISKGVSEVFNGMQMGLGDELATEIGQRASELKSELDIEFAKSPATYLAKYDPSLSAMQGALLDPNPERAASAFESFSARADALYDERNTPEGQRTYLPAGVAKGYKSRFEMAMTSGNFEEANNIYSTLEKMGGDKAYGIMKEVGMTEQQMAIGEISDSNARADLLRLNQSENKKILEDGFRDYATRNSIKEADILSDLEDPYFDSLKMAGYMSPQSQLNAQTVKQQVELLYKSNLMNNMSRDEAAKAAWDVFKKDNTLVKTNQKYEIALPKSFSPTAIQRTQEMFDMLDNSPNEEIAKNLNLPSNVRADDIADNGLWSVDKASGRIVLLARRYGPNGTMETMAVNDANGKPISFSAQDLESKRWDISPTKLQVAATNISKVEGVEAGKARALEVIRNRFYRE